MAMNQIHVSLSPPEALQRFRDFASGLAEAETVLSERAVTILNGRAMDLGIHPNDVEIITLQLFGSKITDFAISQDTIPENAISACHETVMNIDCSDLPSLWRNPIDGADVILVRISAATFASSNGLLISPFYCYKYPVTVEQYRFFIESTGTQRRHLSGAPDHPVTGITWEEASAYARWANASLPSIAQWEAAASEGNSWRYPWGDGLPEQIISKPTSHWGKPSSTHAVGSYPFLGTPNGIMDMLGNVREWCEDTADTRCLVKGCLEDEIESCSITSLMMCEHDCWSSDIGFRCVVELAAVR